MFTARWVSNLIHEGTHHISVKRVLTNNWWRKLITLVYPAIITRSGTAFHSHRNQPKNAEYYLTRYAHLPQDSKPEPTHAQELVNTDGICFDFLSEGIVELTSLKIMQTHFPALAAELQNPKLRPLTPYIEIASFIEGMCQSISHHSPIHPTPESAFLLFQRASFGKGDWLPLARAIETTWGKGAFTRFKDIMTYYDFVQRDKADAASHKWATQMLETFLHDQSEVEK